MAQTGSKAEVSLSVREETPGDEKIAIMCQYADSSSRTWLQHGELVARIMGETLRNCTADARRYYLACQRNITKFELEIIRQALAEVNGEILDRYKANNHAFHPKSEWERPDNHQLRCKNDIGSMEAQLLAKLQWFDSLEWHLDLGDNEQVSASTAYPPPVPPHIVSMIKEPGESKHEGVTLQNPSNGAMDNTTFVPASEHSFAEQVKYDAAEDLIDLNEDPMVIVHEHTDVRPVTPACCDVFGLIDSRPQTSTVTGGDVVVELDDPRVVGTLINFDHDDTSPDCITPADSNELTPIEKFAYCGGPIKESAHSGSPLRRGGLQASRNFARPIFDSQPSVNKSSKMTQQNYVNPPNPSTAIYIPNEDFIDRLYGNESERQTVIRMHKDSSGRVPQIFQFGVQYAPNTRTAVVESGHERSDYKCQSVIISDLPVDAGLRHVMPRVRGGSIVRATLANSTSLGVGSTAFVVFAKWEEAHAYVRYAKNNPDHITILGQQATVNLAGTPTYPLRQPEGPQTRCLEFRGIPEPMCRQLIVHVEVLFRHAEDALEDMWYDETGSALFLFKNVDFANRFDNFIRHRDEYLDQAHNLVCAEDPCSAPLTRLAGPTSFARGSSESLLEDWITKKYGVDDSKPGDVEPHSPAEDATSAATTAADIAIDDAIDPKAVQPVNNKKSSNNNFNTPGEEEVGWKFYTMKEYFDKYGYKDWRKNKVQWLADFPHVGEMKKSMPMETTDDGDEKLASVSA
ncbi:hypothetical protein SCAR479_08764 [Seiridium cardinale]|uniref:Uncharacterized protein n=1 Tax=Seiridium cardinale TaxID=138064 RepID=A0ABR2XLJ8_9PEZI